MCTNLVSVPILLIWVLSAFSCVLRTSHTHPQTQSVLFCKNVNIFYEGFCIGSQSQHAPVPMICRTNSNRHSLIFDFYAFCCVVIMGIPLVVICLLPCLPPSKLAALKPLNTIWHPSSTWQTGIQFIYEVAANRFLAWWLTLLLDIFVLQDACILPWRSTHFHLCLLCLADTQRVLQDGAKCHLSTACLPNCTWCVVPCYDTPYLFLADNLFSTTPSDLY